MAVASVGCDRKAESSVYVIVTCSWCHYRIHVGGQPLPIQEWLVSYRLYSQEISLSLSINSVPSSYPATLIVVIHGNDPSVIPRRRRALRLYRSLKNRSYAQSYNPPHNPNHPTFISHSILLNYLNLKIFRANSMSSKRLTSICAINIVKADTSRSLHICFTFTSSFARTLALQRWNCICSSRQIND
jgi:hypothetical protein